MMNWEDYFQYDESSPSGLIWKVSRGKQRVGSTAGSKDKDGYFQVGLKGKVYKVHRIVWIIHHGLIPEGLEIDHLDRVKSNNKIDNLQLKSHRLNCLNRSSTTKYPGVKKRYSRFIQNIRINGNLVYLGSFDTEEQAYSAYCNKAKELDNNFNELIVENK